MIDCMELCIVEYMYDTLYDKQMHDQQMYGEKCKDKKCMPKQ